jgi:signal transduction histidine kinase
MARMNIRQFLTPESIEVARERQREQIEGRIPSQRYELEILRKDGTRAVIETGIRLIIESGHAVAFHNIARDVTAERRMQDNLRYYLQQITKAQEEERKRIARELHDETAQDLYALNRELDNFLRVNTGLSAEFSDFLKGVAGQIKGVLQGVRRFDRDLRPPILDDLGLLSTLRWLVDEIKGQSGIEADITVSGSEKRLSAEAELIVFRIVQEALRNVVKHAEASKVKVRVDFGQGKMKLSISDNGKGFDPGESLAELPRAGKLGLAGMEERVRLLGGTLKIQSKLGKGTTVEIEIPA